jgi:hypothetical protein
MRIFKRDSEPVVVRKIAEQVVRDHVKKTTRPLQNYDITKYNYSSGGGGFGGGSGTGLVYSIQMHMYGIAGMATSPTFAERSYLKGVAGIHLYDTTTVVEMRINLINDPLYCLGL